MRFSNSCFHVLAFILVLFLVSEAKMPGLNMNNDMTPPRLELAYPLEALKPGSILQVTVTIDSGWHINSDKPADEFLLGTTLTSQANGITFAAPKWPKPLKQYSEALQLENLVFGGTFTVSVPIVSLAAQYDSTSTVVILNYQACSNSICLAPTKVTASLGMPPPMSFDLKKKELSNSKPVSSEAHSSLALLLFFAFVGGLILNLMPCVLPVLSIKAFSLAKHARESRRKLLSFGFAMTLGILCSFWVLATVVILMQKAGGVAGWGFQFQNPSFLVGMIVLITLFALNLFGVFEIWLPSTTHTHLNHKATRKGLLGSFMNGVLMTLLSTPCSAPFLGTAMGFAFSQPPAMLILFFTIVGIGLAFPYMMLSLFPASLRWIPKPGNWMVHFKQFLGFLMLATSAWLLWVLGRQAGTQVMGIVLLLLVVLGFGAWTLGLLASPGNAFWKVVLGWMIVGAIGFGGWLFYIQPLIIAVPESNSVDCAVTGEDTPLADGWYKWTPELVERMQNKGKTIFVDFTADWCITCKTNESVVLSQKPIRLAFEQMGVILMRGDFTRPDARISAVLKSFGRSGVPLYVIYPGMEPAKPIVLSEILTPEEVIDALMQAGPSKP